MTTRIQAAAERFGDRDALWVGGRTIRYRDLLGWSEELRRACGEGAQVVAVIGNRRVPTYATIFACLAGAIAYVPINPAWPQNRILDILAQSRPDAVVLGEGCAPELVAHLEASSGGARLVHAAMEEDALRIRSSGGGAPDGTRGYDPAGLAYIMFTSGSTGQPKGVPIAASNLAAYVANLSALAPFDETDRVVQTVETTFDLSVHDMALTWTAGAMLAVVPEASAPLGPRFVRQLKLTSWLSVPSVAAQANNLKLLAADAMPTLRTSFFCGEALPTAIAETWRAAAPNSSLFNIYGPTEATIAFSAFDFTDRALTGDVVPLGFPIGNEEMRIGANDEILLSGAQVFDGYLLNPAKTAEALIEIEGRRWYRTGDRGGYDDEVGFTFGGRMDAQIKLRGYRVELGDVEAALRHASGSALAAVVPNDAIADSTFNSITAFVAGSTLSEVAIEAGLRERLPSYMLPARIVLLDAMPKNSNDKIDRLALAQTLVDG
jgi:D-alanine--poly(phosphoribitol) ligase subunit 1